MVEKGKFRIKFFIILCIFCRVNYVPTIYYTLNSKLFILKNFLSLLILLFSFSLVAQENVVIDRYAQSSDFGSINHLIIGKNNNKWLATDNGVFKLASFEGKATAIGKKTKATQLLQNNRGDVWAAYADGTVEMLNGETSIKVSEEKIAIRSMEFIKSKLWIGTDQGLFVYGSKSKKLLHHFTSDNSKLKSNSINFVHLDLYDAVWVGTNKGVARFINEKCKKVYDSGMDFKVITEKNSERWMVTDEEMFIVYDENRWNTIGLKDDIHNGRINDMVIDGKGNVYIASNKLVKLDPYNATIESYSDDLGLLSKKCLTLSSDAYNHVYIGTADAGLFRLRFSDTAIETLSATCLLEKPISCYGKTDAELKVITVGGTPPYRYKWSDSSLKGNNPKGLKAGTYQVTVTDKKKVEFEIEMTFEEPEEINISLLESRGVSGFNKRDGFLKVQAFGKNNDFSYSWSNGKKGDAIKRLSPKEYTVTATDANGCTAVASYEVSKGKLMPELDITKLEVGQTLRINHLYFKADSSVITDQSYEVLDEVFEFLNTNNKVVIEIGGHTNNIPSHEYCDYLSNSRAQNVATYMYNKGIAETRIVYKGYGKRNPIAKNTSLAGRKKNQRVEIKILSVE